MLLKLSRARSMMLVMATIYFRAIAFAASALALSSCGAEGGSGTTLPDTQSASIEPSSLEEQPDPHQPGTLLLEEQVVLEPAAALGEHVRYMALINIDGTVDRYTIERLSFGAFFSTFDAPADAALVQSLLDTEPGCIVERSTVAELEQAAQDVLSELPASRGVSAGRELMTSTSGGTWWSLLPAEQPGLYVARDGERFFGPVPEDLNVDVPGDVFPGVAAVHVPVVEPMSSLKTRVDGAPLVLSSGAFPPIPADISLTWPAGSDPDAYVLVRLSSVGSGNGPDAEVSTVTCRVSDTGRFSLPEDIIADADGTYDRLQVRRSIRRWEVRGDVLIGAENTSLYAPLATLERP